MNMSSWVRLIVLFSALVFIDGALAAGKTGSRIAVLDIEAANNIGPELAEAVSDAMRGEILKAGKYEVLGRNKINEKAGGRRCQIATYNKECFTALGELLRVEKIITGSMVFYNKLYYSSFIIVDAKTGKVENIAEDQSDRKRAIESVRNLARILVSRRFFFLEPKPKPDWKNQKEINEFFQGVIEVRGRDDWQKPEMVVDHLPIEEGDVIAEIGAGTGYFTRWFSKKVGKKGTVYAVDIEKDMLEYIEKRIKREGLGNVKTVLAGEKDPSLPKESADLAFLSDVYVALSDKQDYLQKLKKVLKRQGMLAIVDYQAPPIPSAPFSAIDFDTLNIKSEETSLITDLLVVNRAKNIDNLACVGIPFEFRVAKEKVIEEVTKAGFKLNKDYDFLPYEYFLLFSKE